ncbi:MAG: YciI family protein [Candidatus Kariarchaeaceae archaeon]|jgi:uncharacterized protein YciI
MEKHHYYAIIRPTRKDFITNPTDEDNKIMSDHFIYLKDLLNQGKLYLAGPTLIESDPFGLVIFETASEAEARSLLERDPSVSTGIQVIADLRPIRISLSKS